MKIIYMKYESYNDIERIHEHIQDFKTNNPQIAQYLEIDKTMRPWDIIDFTPITDMWLSDGTLNILWTYFINIYAVSYDVVYIIAVLRGV